MEFWSFIAFLSTTLMTLSISFMMFNWSRGGERSGHQQVKSRNLKESTAALVLQEFVVDELHNTRSDALIL